MKDGPLVEQVWGLCAPLDVTKEAGGLSKVELGQKPAILGPSIWEESFYLTLLATVSFRSISLFLCSPW